MPIYAYRCEECGFAKDALQKMSDAPLTDCPSCGKPSFKKQLTAAGFQLKGTGWYVTDFRGGQAAPGTSSSPESSAPGTTGSTSESTASAAPAASATPATPAAPAAPAAAKSTTSSGTPSAT